MLDSGTVALSRETRAYHEGGHIVAAVVLDDDSISFESKDPADRAKAYEREALIHLAGPCAQVKLDPAMDARRASKEEWRTDELKAKARAADAVLATSRPDGPAPEYGHGMVMLETEEAMEAVSILFRLREDARALVAKHWPAIASIAAALLERDLSWDDMCAIVRASPSGRPQ